MEKNNAELTLLGKVVIKGEIHLVTGLRIGGPTTGLKIGGVDQPVISDAFDRPYIPGSSLKGKLRTLIEKKEGVHQNEKGEHEYSDKDEDIPKNNEEYNKCSICKIWGIPGNTKISVPALTRLIIRDVPLDESSITQEMKKNLELEWSEIKMENTISRVSGRSSGLRTINRVPAGAKFKPLEIIYNVYEEQDKDLLKKVFEAMELLEYDYLGGMGSRGYGKVKFNNITVFWNKREDYESGNLNQTKIFEGKIDDDKIIKEDASLVTEIVKDFEAKIKPELK